MNRTHLNSFIKSSHCIKTILLLFIVLSFLTSCNVFNSDEKLAPLEFDKMEIQYYKNGGWINSSQLDIQPSGEATAKVLAHGSNEVLNQNISMLNEVQKNELALSFASFSNFSRHYQPEEHWTDQNTYTFILTYEGSTDTVSVYYPAKTSLPKDLNQLITDFEIIHQSILDEEIN